MAARGGVPLPNLGAFVVILPASIVLALAPAMMSSSTDRSNRRLAEPITRCNVT